MTWTAVDPIRLQELLWPDVEFFLQQREVLYSLLDNEETYVPAGNMLGKDFVAGYAALWFFLAHPVVRVVTTSVKDDHLRVLWGEILRFVQTAKYPLVKELGGPLIINHRDIRKTVNDSSGGQVCPISYLRGMVSERGEGLSGHHAPQTLLIVDEASGVDDAVYSAGQGWMKRLLVIGNPNPCTNFFFHGIKGGDLLAKGNGHYHRRIIRIKAEDSPNVRLAMKQVEQGNELATDTLVPGILDYQQYLSRRELWDPVRQCVGLDGEFYEGAEVLLYPPQWLNQSEQQAFRLGSGRKAKVIGIDTGEGVAKTVWAVCDELGLIDLVSKLTPDTAQITGDTLALMRLHGVPAGKVFFDAGGGGKQHADRLRQQGYKVQTVAFGEGVTPPIHRGIWPMEQRTSAREAGYAYRNRRAEMYGMLRERLDPSLNPQGVFALPSKFTELRRQLSLFPMRFDGEGRMELPPKQRRDRNSNVQSLTEIIGHSPDEADALVLAIYGLFRKHVTIKVGAITGKGKVHASAQSKGSWGQD